jgi:MFS family permease
MDHESRTAMNDARSFAALRQRPFRGLFTGAALAMMADSIEHVISYWILFEKFQSPALGGFAVVSHWLPFLLFSVYSGAAAERWDPRRMIQIGMGLFMAVSIAWGVLFATDALEIWHAMVLLTVHGLAGVFWSPAQQLMIHEVVEAKEVYSAVRLMATARWLGLLLGPAVGAGILLVFGPTWGIFLNALIYLPMVLWLRKAPYQHKPVAARLNAFADIVATGREISGNPLLIALILLAGGTSLLVGNAYHAQMPEFAHHLGHYEADFTYGMLLGADAAGALVAGLALESRGFLAPSARRAFTLAMLWCAVIVGFAMTRSYALAVALLFVAGFLELAYNAMAQTLVQLHAPAPIRGRVIGLYAMSALGMRTFSGVSVGLGGSLIGIHVSLALSAAALLALLALGLGLATRWRS